MVPHISKHIILFINNLLHLHKQHLILLKSIIILIGESAMLCDLMVPIYQVVQDWKLERVELRMVVRQERVELVVRLTVKDRSQFQKLIWKLSEFFRQGLHITLVYFWHRTILLRLLIFVFKSYMVLSWRLKLNVKIIDLIFQEHVILLIYLISHVNVLLYLGLELIHIDLDRYVLISELEYFLFSFVYLFSICLWVCFHLGF